MMKWILLPFALAVLTLAQAAQGEIFKCTSAQGQVSFAAVPCSDSSAEAARQRQGPPRMLRDGEPVDHAHKINLKATEFLQVSGRRKVIVYETESYKLYQRNRPPPPTAVSQCAKPLYTSQCFDPSGGQSVNRSGR